MATHFVSAIGFCFALYCSQFSLRNTSNCQVCRVTARCSRLPEVSASRYSCRGLASRMSILTMVSFRCRHRS